jgi:hypothetical protein
VANHDHKSPDLPIEARLNILRPSQTRPNPLKYPGNHLRDTNLTWLIKSFRKFVTQ